MVRGAVGLVLVVVLSLALGTPASAGRAHGASVRGGFHGGGFRGGFHHHPGFHHHHGFHRFGCCFGPVVVSSVFVSAAVAAPLYANPYPVYAAPAYVPPAPVYEASISGSPVVCYVGGCYHLQGNGVSVPYQWVWVPAVPAPPPAPPSARPNG